MHLCIQCMIFLAEGVAPFGYPWIKACSRLPMAFRSVPRPSSPPGAKASTECPSFTQSYNSHVSINNSRCKSKRYLTTANPQINPKTCRLPTMHRNHPSEPHNHHQTNPSQHPLGTSPTTNHLDENPNKRPDKADHPRNATVHHKPPLPSHASEHSNPTAITASAHHAKPGQTTHCRQTRASSQQNQHTHPDAPKPIHPDKRTFAPDNQTGSKHPAFRPHPLRRVTQTKKPKLDFPYTNLAITQGSALAGRPWPGALLITSIWWRWTGSNRRPPACKAGALPIELHPQS